MKSHMKSQVSCNGHFLTMSACTKLHDIPTLFWQSLIWKCSSSCPDAISFAKRSLSQHSPVNIVCNDMNCIVKSFLLYMANLELNWKKANLLWIVHSCICCLQTCHKLSHFSVVHNIWRMSSFLNVKHLLMFFLPLAICIVFCMKR